MDWLFDLIFAVWKILEFVWLNGPIAAYVNGDYVWLIFSTFGAFCISCLVLMLVTFAFLLILTAASGLLNLIQIYSGFTFPIFGAGIKNQWAQSKKRVAKHEQDMLRLQQMKVAYISTNRPLTEDELSIAHDIFKLHGIQLIEAIDLVLSKLSPAERKWLDDEYIKGELRIP